MLKNVEEMLTKVIIPATTFSARHEGFSSVTSVRHIWHKSISSVNALGRRRRLSCFPGRVIDHGACPGYRWRLDRQIKLPHGVAGFFSAFLRRHSEERGGLLVHVVTAAFRALDPIFFVFCKGEDDFKWLLTIFAVEFVARHGDLPYRKAPQRNSRPPMATDSIRTG